MSSSDSSTDLPEPTAPGDFERAREPGWPCAVYPCVFVLGTMLTMGLVHGTVAYFVGKDWEDSRRFLKNYRAPNGFELHMSFHHELCSWVQ